MPFSALRPFAPHSRRRDLTVSFAAERLTEGFSFRFTLTPLDADLVLPALKPPAERRRRDELWTHTCFEIFTAPAGAADYLEFNLAPSGDWNAYRFDDYRTGMRAGEGEFRLSLAVTSDPSDRTWSGVLTGSGVMALLGGAPVVMGASVVLEYSGGFLAYWALAHTAEIPDFHRRDAFVLTL